MSSVLLELHRNRSPSFVLCHLNDLRNQVLGLGALNLDTGYGLMTAAAKFFHHGLDIDGPVTAGRNTDAIVALIENGADMDIIHGQQLIGCLGDNNGNIAVILGTAGMNRNSKTRNGFLHFRNDLGPEDNRGVIFFKKLGYGMRIGTIAPQIAAASKVRSPVWTAKFLVSTTIPA